MLPILICGMVAVHAQGSGQGNDPGNSQGTDQGSAEATKGVAAQIERIQQEIAEIRGLPFKSTVKAASQTTADFKKRIDQEIDKELTAAVEPYYGQITRKLGLYRGPLIEDMREMMQSVLASQAAAYYEPDQNTFFVLFSDLPEMMQGVLYSHELYHGLQHQQFDLTRYMDDAAEKTGLSQDALLARQAVVEGEATYIMTLWAVKRTTGSLPDRALLKPIVAMQSQLDMTQMRAMLKQPEVAKLVGKEVQASMDAAEQMPAYLIQTLVGAYLKGLAFVFAVQERGWDEVAKLYGERPPASTEQILHPEKWLADERPTEFAWPSFEKERALRDWQLLDQDVLGEFQWRIVFQEHGLKTEAEAVAAGWNGDRYAVLKRKDSDALLLLLRTSWDTVEDATEFTAAYRRLLAVKYATAEPSRVVQQGKEVTIVEGGTEGGLDSLLRVASKATRKAAAARR